MKLTRRGKIFGITTTGILIWGGQTYVWNPFWIDYAMYPWYTLFWAFTITWIIPHRKREEKEILETPGLETLQEPEEDAV